MILSRASEILVIVAILLAPWPYGSALEVAQFSLAALLLLAASLDVLGRALAGSALPRAGVVAPALALPGLAAVQIAAGRSAAPVWTAEALLLEVALLATFLTCRQRAKQRPAAYRLAAAILIVCAAEATFGAVQWSIAPNQVYGRTHTTISAPFGSFINHNHFAGLIEMGTLLALGLAIGHARRVRHFSPASLALGGLSLSLAAAHAASRSRGGLLSLGVGTLFCLSLFALTRHGRTPRLQSAVLAALGAAALIGFGLIAVPPSARRHLATLLQGPTDSSGSYRVDIAAATLRLVAAHPLMGIGVGAYEDAIPAFKRGHGDVRTTHAESDVLEFLAEGGIAGLAVLAWLTVAIGPQIAAHIEQAPDPLRKGLVIGAASGAAALAVHSFVDFNLRTPSNALVFVLLLGVASAVPGQELAMPPGHRRLGYLTAALALLAFGGGGAWRGYGACMLQSALAASDLNTRIEQLDRVLGRHPYSAEAWRARGLAWRDLSNTTSPLREQRLRRALHDLERALRLRPRWAEAWADRGWVLAMEGRLAEGELALAKAGDLDPTNSGIRAFRLAFERRKPS